MPLGDRAPGDSQCERGAALHQSGLFEQRQAGEPAASPDREGAEPASGDERDAGSRRDGVYDAYWGPEESVYANV